MLGQALAGAARRGSVRLKELEDRAYKVSDRTTERLINKFDTWDTKNKASKTAYMNAARKLKNLSNLNLDNGQIEMILAGGLEGAENFINAYENDKKLQFQEWDKIQQDTPSHIKSPMDFSSGLSIQKPKFNYNKDIFLNEMFERSDEYLEAKEHNKANFGRELKAQAALYAQSQNPFTAFDTLSRESRLEADQTKSLLGIGVPQEFIESTVMQQLKAAGIQQPEKVLGELGKKTGWKTIVYDDLDATVKAEIIANNLAVKTNKEQHKKLVEENKFLAISNPRLLLEQNLRIEGLVDTNEYNKNRLEQSTMELNIAKLKDIDWHKAEIERIDRLNILEEKALKKQLEPQTVHEAIYDFNDQLVYWKGELGKNPDNAEAQKHIGVLSNQMDQQFMLLAKMKEAERDDYTPAQYASVFKWWHEDIKKQNGFVDAVKMPDPDDPGSMMIQGQPAHYLVDGVKHEVGSDTWNKLERESQLQAEAKLLKYAGKVGGDGLWAMNDPDDRALKLLINGFKITEEFGEGDITQINMNDYALMNNYEITVDDVVMSLVQPTNANTTKPEIINMLIKEDKSLTYLSAEELVNNAYKQIDKNIMAKGYDLGDVDIPPPPPQQPSKIDKIVKEITNIRRRSQDGGINTISSLKSTYKKFPVGTAVYKENRKALLKRIKEYYNVNDQDALDIFNRLGLQF